MCLLALIKALILNETLRSFHTPFPSTIPLSKYSQTANDTTTDHGRNMEHTTDEPPEGLRPTCVDVPPGGSSDNLSGRTPGGVLGQLEWAYPRGGPRTQTNLPLPLKMRLPSWVNMQLAGVPTSEERARRTSKRTSGSAEARR